MWTGRLNQRPGWWKRIGQGPSLFAHSAWSGRKRISANTSGSIRSRMSSNRMIGEAYGSFEAASAWATNSSNENGRGSPKRRPVGRLLAFGLGERVLQSGEAEQRERRKAE